MQVPRLTHFSSRIHNFSLPVPKWGFETSHSSKWQLDVPKFMILQTNAL